MKFLIGLIFLLFFEQRGQAQPPCVYDDNGAFIHCPPSIPDQEIFNRARVSSEQNRIIAKIRDVRINGVAYFGYGSLEAFKSQAAQKVRDIVDQGIEDCEGSKAVCEGIAELLGKLLFGVLDEAFAWNCGVFYQQCLAEVETWDEIFDEMLTNPVRDSIMKKNLGKGTEFGTGQGGGGAGSTGSSTTGSRIDGTSPKDKPKEKEQDELEKKHTQ